MDMLYQKAAAEPDCGVYAILHPGTIKGYVFMEARDLGDAIQLVQGVPHTKGFVKGEVDFEKEVQPLLQPKSSVLDVRKGDLIELIAGPFKGEKAKVIRVDESKEEVTVELIEAAVPIPVTAKGMHVKVVDRVTQEKAAESQRRDVERRKGPIIGEGPLPALRGREEERGSAVRSPQSSDKTEDRGPQTDSEPTRPERAENKERPKKIVFGMAAEKPAEPEEDIEKVAEDIPEEEFDEEKAAEEDAKFFADDDKDDDVIDKVP